MTIASSDERFRHGAEDYAAYLQTLEGRWRADLAFANLQDFLPIPQVTRPLCALDIGCGTAVNGLSLARLGFHVTLLDSSPAMLNLARRAASSAGITDGVDFYLGDAAQLSALIPDLSFDVVLCHNVLEYLDDPASLLRAAARALRDDSAILSIVVRNQAGEVLKAAILSGDLAAAEENLTAQMGSRISLWRRRAALYTGRAERHAERVIVVFGRSAGYTRSFRLLAAQHLAQLGVCADSGAGEEAGQPARIRGGGPLHAVPGAARKA